MKLTFVLIILFVTCLSSNAQVLNYQGEKYSPESRKSQIDKLLYTLGATEIEWNTKARKNTVFPAKLKSKKGVWQLYYAYGECLISDKESSLKKYNFSLPRPTMEFLSFTLVEKKGKYGFVSLTTFNATDLEWDELVFENMDYYDNALLEMDSIDKMRMNNDEYHFENDLEPIDWNQLIVSARKENLWYRIELRLDVDGIYIYKHGVGEKNKSDLLSPTKWYLVELKILKKMRKAHQLDVLIPLGDDNILCYGRNSKTHMWGVYDAETREELIPAVYDTVKYHTQSFSFEVWKNKSVQVYNENYKLLFENGGFEDFEEVFLDYFYGIALKKDGDWQLYDPKSGELLVKGKAKTLEDLVDLWLNRFDEE